MASHRFEIDTAAGPSSQGSLDGTRKVFQVRVRLFDGPGVVDGLTGQPAGEEDVYTDLRPQDARDLAFRLLEHAEEAEQLTAQADWWQVQR